MPPERGAVAATAAEKVTVLPAIIRLLEAIVLEISTPAGLAVALGAGACVTVGTGEGGVVGVNVGTGEGGVVGVSVGTGEGGVVGVAGADVLIGDSVARGLAVAVEAVAVMVVRPTTNVLLVSFQA